MVDLGDAPGMTGRTFGAIVRRRRRCAGGAFLQMIRLR